MTNDHAAPIIPTDDLNASIAALALKLTTYVSLAPGGVIVLSDADLLHVLQDDTGAVHPRDAEAALAMAVELRQLEVTEVPPKGSK